MADIQIAFDPTYTSTQRSKKIKTKPPHCTEKATNTSNLYNHISTQTPSIPLPTKEVKDNETQTSEINANQDTSQFDQLLCQNNQLLYELRCVKGVLKQYLERQ